MDRQRIKLSKAQATIIERLRSGDILNHVQSLDETWFNGEANIKCNTISKLERLGLIVLETYSRYQLTEKGRTAVIQMNTKSQWKTSKTTKQ